MLPLLTLVDDRIVAYEEKAKQWEAFSAEAAGVTLDEEHVNKIEGCRSILNAIISGYNRLHDQLISESNGRGADASVLDGFLETERQDLGYLESDCQQIVTTNRESGGWIAGTMDRMLEEKEQELAEKMASGEYQQVVELYPQLPLEKGQRPSYKTSYSYGQALLRSGREEEAAQVFQDLLSNLQVQNEVEREFKLMQLIADLQFGMEQYNSAFEKYTDIINRYAGLGENIDWARRQQAVISGRSTQGIEVKNFAEIMRGYLGYNPERDAYRVFLLASRFVEDFPDSSVIPTVNHILYESRDRADEWFAMVMQRVGTLKAEKKYQEALQVIDRLPHDALPVEKKELLNTVSDELVSASFEQEESQRQAMEEALQDVWNKGQAHLRNKEYDQAIEVFASLKDTAYAEQANEKIVEASQLAAQEDRRTAAELFVQSGKMSDPTKRADLLLQSRWLLKGILEKYPQSGLTEKVQKNLERIEEEIRTIDPALLTEPEPSTNDQIMIQQPAGTTINGIPLGKWKEDVPSSFPGE